MSQTILREIDELGDVHGLRHHRRGKPPDRTLGCLTSVGNTSQYGMIDNSVKITLTGRITSMRSPRGDESSSVASVGTSNSMILTVLTLGVLSGVSTDADGVALMRLTTASGEG